ncbi:STN domain-containing protein [Bacteroides sp. CR5/BHMF/2]|nr:STN domain-containing protein [Bacteroides sp. CR5/BHMF/2]
MEYKKIHLLIIVCLFSIGIFAQSGTEKISISFSKIPLKEAMTKVEKASGYLFSYDATEINTEQLVSLNCKNEEIRLALRKMFDSTTITFKFQNRQIVLSPASKEVSAAKKEWSKPSPVLFLMGRENLLSELR